MEWDTYSRKLSKENQNLPKTLNSIIKMLFLLLVF